MTADSKDTLEDLRKDLEGRSKGQAWYELARRLNQAVEDAGVGEDVVRRIAVKATSLSSGVLGRYLSIFRRVKAAALAADVAPEMLLAPGFNAVEVAVRLYDRSPVQGLEALKALAAGSMGFTKLQRLSSETPVAGNSVNDVRSRAHRRRGLEVAAVKQALERWVGSIFPEGSFLHPRPPLRFLRPNGMEVRRSDGVCVCGMETFVSADERGFEASFPSAVLLSKFLPQSYLVFSPSLPRSLADQAVAALDQFGYGSVGVLAVAPDRSIEVLRRPVAGPDIDRPGEYEELRADLAPR